MNMPLTQAFLSSRTCSTKKIQSQLKVPQQMTRVSVPSQHPHTARKWRGIARLCVKSPINHDRVQDVVLSATSDKDELNEMILSIQGTLSARCNGPAYSWLKHERGSGRDNKSSRG